ncbi:MAG: ribonuclease J [Pseudomonadota bacterium]
MTNPAKLVYVALGGAGEIGMNMYLYGIGEGAAQRWIVVDTGVAFPDMESSPGVDIITADPGFIAARADQLEGIFITHAHEDHVGAVGRLWPNLKAPIYAREFTAEIARLKMEDAGQDAAHVQTVAAWPAQVDTGSFKVGFLPISHSVPESSALVIDTAAGRVIHSGDFKIDRDPQVGEPFDDDLIREVSKDGVLALVCDSTNVFNRHEGRSEADLIAPITELLRNTDGLIVATTFASNLARVSTMAKAARAADRSILVLGRAMNRMISVGRKVGLLDGFPDTVSADEARDMPAEHLFVLASGSQGERRAVSAQLAQGNTHSGVELKEGDTFLFSSKTIPGNEVAVARIHNQLAELGVDVVEESGGLYHVSGHANRPDLAHMQDLVQPQYVVPMHGEFRHLRAHAKLAEEKGRMAVVAPNGTMVELSGNAPKTVEMIETGRRYMDGSVSYGALDGIVRERLRMAQRGLVVVNLIFDERNRLLDDAWVEAKGLPTDVDGPQPYEEVLEAELTEALNGASPKVRADDDAVEKLVTGRLNTVSSRLIGKKPLSTVLITRLAD